jgi:hypothetical protein
MQDVFGEVRCGICSQCNGTGKEPPSYVWDTYGKRKAVHLLALLLQQLGYKSDPSSPSLPASKQKYAAEPLLARVQGSVEGMP